MINLYEILGITHTASTAEIQAALSQKQAQLDPQIIKGVQEWLLNADVRARYDARLRQEQPAFFQTESVQAALPKTEQGYYTPRLYNPTIAAVLAMFLSPLIGAWLCAINWRELGNQQAAQHNMYVVYGTLAFGFITILLYLMAGVQTPFYAGTLISLAWFFTLGKPQLDFLRREAGDDYARKSWGKVIAWIIGGGIIYLICFFILFQILLSTGQIHPSVMEEMMRALQER